MNTKGIRFLAVLAVMVMAFAAIAIVAPAAEESTAMSTSQGTSASAVTPTLQEQTINGIAVSDVTYLESQKVIVNGTWEIGDLTHHPIVTIQGELEVPADSKIIINAGAQLVVKGLATIEGSIEMEETQALKYLNGTSTVDYKVTTDEYTVGAALPAYDSGSANILHMPGVLYITGTSAIDSGVVIIESTSTLDGRVAVNYGTLAIGDFGDVTLSNDSAIAVTNDGSIAVAATAALEFNGTIGATTIYNYGAVIIDSNLAVAGDIKIYQWATDATVGIYTYVVASTDNELTITDSGLVLYTERDGKNYTEYMVGTATGNNVNTLVIDNVAIDGVEQIVIGGLFVTEQVTSRAPTTLDTKDLAHNYIAAADKVFTNTFLVAGDVGAASVKTEDGSAGTHAPQVQLQLVANCGASIADETELALGGDIDFQITGSLTVAGLLDASTLSATGTPAVAAPKITLNESSVVTLSGEGMILYNNNNMTESNNTTKKVLGAAITLDKKDKQYAVMTIDKALTIDFSLLDVKTITLYGNVTTKKTATLESGVTLNTGTFTLTVGNSASIVLTIESDAKLRGTVTVKGTLYAEKFTDVSATVTSDVLSQQTDEKGKVVKDGWAKWTNVTTALAEASPGQIITITKDGPVTISSDLEIKSGVTLVSGTGNIVLGKGVTLTVNGTLKVTSNVQAADGVKFAVKAENISGGNQTAAIVVNGTFMISTATNYSVNETAGQVVTAGAPIAGAYYQSIDDEKASFYTISPLSVAINNSENVMSDIVINGAVNASELLFMATDYMSKITVGNGISAAIPTTLAVGELFLDDTSLVLSTSENGLFNGIVSSLNSEIQLSGAYSDTTAVTIKDTDGDLTIAGKLKVVNKSGIATVTEGTVIAGTSTTAFESVMDGLWNENDSKKFFIVADGATLQVDTATADYIAVYGSVLVPAGGKTLTVTNDLSLLGSLTVEPATASKTKGNLNITGGTLAAPVKLNFGVLGTYVAAGATISGPITVAGNAAYIVMAGTTLDSEAQASLDGMYSIELYVGGALYATVYAPTVNTQITMDDIGLTDAKLEGWTDGTNEIDADDPITINEKGKEYGAKIKENIYRVIVITDYGIKSVAIDGVQMVWQNNNLFQTFADIKAGVHTVSYTLASGYAGTAQLYTEDGTILKDLKFTASGTDWHNAVAQDYVEIDLQLTGIEQSGGDQPEPTPVEPTKDGFGITEILLVVLVILIAIMVIVMILRLNRS